MRVLMPVASSLIVLVAAVSARPAAAANFTVPANGARPAITGFLERPPGPGPFPAVLVLHGCEGLVPLETETVAALVRQGYVGVAIDTLAPQNLHNACAGEGAQAIAASVPYAYATLAWLAQQPFVNPARLGIIGFSMGAIEVLGLVDPLRPYPPPPGLRAAVAYYPNCNRRSPNVAVPLQILDGDADDWNPPGPCQALADAATAAGSVVRITTYPGATHAFNQVANAPRTYLGHTLIYDPAATADASAKTAAFLATYLNATP